MIKRMRVEPYSELSGALPKRRVVNPVTIANGFVYLSGMPPFDPQSGEITPAPFEQQCERVMAQLKACLEAGRHVAGQGD